MTRAASLAMGMFAVGAFASCGTSEGETEPTSSHAPTSATPTNTAVEPVDATVSGLDIALGNSDLEDAPAPLIDLDELRSGGPPPDGIPAIDDPKFVAASEVDFLGDREPVLALDIDGDARAYPVQILTWHEIVNDVVGDTPVAVTYCPLCNSALAYDRTVDGQLLDFGTSGMLWNSALVMYDRPTETLWSHFTGEGIVGALTGTELDVFPMSTVGWSTWRDANPDGLVLTTDTGFSRDYGRNPYPGYDDIDGRPFLFEGEVDGQFTAMTRIVGVERDGSSAGVPLTSLQRDRVVPFEVAGADVVAFWQEGTNSALDSGRISDGDDIGTTGVFEADLDGVRFEFAATAEGFTDDQTATTWDVLGRAISGPLVGEQLAAVPHVDTFWFAWSTFRPDTSVVDP